MQNRSSRLRVGLFSIGLDAYWPQFPGLLERLNGYNAEIEKKLSRPGVDVENLGMIDSAEKGVLAGHEFRARDVDLIFLHVATYALSATVLPVVRRAKTPVVILNLNPEAAIDYDAFNSLKDRRRMTGEWLAWCQACPVPEIANVFRRSGIPFFQVTGTLHDDTEAWAEIEGWMEAAHVAHMLEHNRLGLMGHYYGGMLDIYSDLTRQSAYFGGQIEMIEVDELTALRCEITAAELEARRASFFEAFDVQPDCTAEELGRAARTSVALDRLVERHGLGSLAYYYRGVGIPANEDTISSIILGTSLLTARGIPVAGEYEVKNVQAMKIMDAFKAGGSFSEYYATDFKDDIVLLGHDGPGHLAIAEGRIKVRPLGVYHGKVGRGLSIEMSVRNGPVTLLSVIETENGGMKLLVAEGESVPGPILEIGNTNSRYRFSIGARAFINRWNAEGPAHHCAIGVGHISNKLEKLAALLRLECVRIC
jgi:L-arabinose isomerase